MSSFRDVLIQDTITLIQAMDLLDKTAKKILFIVDHNQKLVASLTDGDIRRWILKGGELNASVGRAANYKPFFINNRETTWIDEVLSQGYEAVPLVDDQGVVADIIFSIPEDGKQIETINMPVVIMAGGLGTRLYPYTKILPKPLIPIGEIPISQHIMNGFHHHGIHDFTMILNHKKNMVKAYFSETQLSYHIRFVDEAMPLGTGGGISLLKGIVTETFILTNCDILIHYDYSKILKHHQEENNLITMVCSVKNTKIPYGVVDIKDDGTIEQMREKPTVSAMINTGMYIVEPRVVEEVENNISIGFPEIIEQYLAQGEKMGVYPISESAWQDMGELDELEEMRRKIEKGLK